MFLHMSVCSGGCAASPPGRLPLVRPPRGRPPCRQTLPEADPPPSKVDPHRQTALKVEPPVLTSSGGHFSGRHASYWNAFFPHLNRYANV